MLYKTYISNTKIFWNNDSLFKPNLFLKHIESLVDFQEIEQTPNFISNTRASLNDKVENNTTYVKVEHINEKGEIKKFLYFVESSINLTSEIKTLNLVLDVWSSYCVDYLRINQNQILTFKRTPVDSLSNYWLLDDPIYNNMPYLSNSHQYVFLSMYNLPEYNKSNYQYDYKGNIKLELFDFSKMETGNGYFVFSALNNNSNEFWCFPILNKYWSKLQGSQGCQAIINNVKSLILNNNKELNDFKNETDHISKFLGVFILPNTTDLGQPIDHYSTGIKSTNAFMYGYKNENYLYHKIYGNGQELKYRIPLKNYCDEKLQLHFKNLNGNKLLNTTILNNTININEFLEYKKTNDNIDYLEIPSFLTFSNSGGVLTLNNRYQKSTNSIIQFSGQLPSLSDEYKQYIAGNQSSINAGIQNAKENHIFGQVSNALGTGMGMLSGSPITSGVNGILGGVRQGLSYNQQMRSINASLADARRSTSLNPAPSNAVDMSYISKYLINKGLGVGNYIEIDIPSDDSINEFNRLNMLYGVSNVYYKEIYIFANDGPYTIDQDSLKELVYNYQPTTLNQINLIIENLSKPFILISNSPQRYFLKYNLELKKWKKKK